MYRSNSLSCSLTRLYPLASGIQRSHGPTLKQPVSDIIFNRSPSDVIKYFPIPADTKHFHVGSGSQVVSVAGVEEKLIYSNLLGSVVAQVPSLQLVADDIVYNAQPESCGLRRYLFQVIGKANPEQEGGAYTVTYGLYDSCPGAGGELIPGTAGESTIPAEQDSAITTVHMQIPAQQTILLPCSLWLGIRTSRDNVGIVMGSPAHVGFF